MKHIRSLLFFAASVVALFISACSQPLDTGTPELAPQFGTTGDDSINVADVNTDGVYLGGLWDNEPALIKYTREGRLPWVKFPKIGASELAMGMSVYDGGMVGVEAAADGYIHVLQNVQGRTSTGESYRAYYLRKYSSTGSLVWQRRFTAADNAEAVTLALDGKGNHYVFTRSNNDVFSLYKHNANGELLWRKSLPDASFDTDVVASPDGSVYLAYAAPLQSHIVKYDAAGWEVWMRTVPFSADYISLGKSSTIYVAGDYYVKEEMTGTVTAGIKLAKLTSTGSNPWVKTVVNGRDFWPSGLGADTQDGVYVGLQKIHTVDAPESLVLRKYGPNAAQQWSRTFELRDGAAFNDVAVLSPSELYLTGAVPEKDLPGVQNGFLIRLNGQGARVWTR